MDLAALVKALEEEFGEGQPPLKRRLAQLMAFSGVGRSEVDELQAGDLFVMAGFPEVEIGDTIASVETPIALPRLVVDELETPSEGEVVVTAHLRHGHLMRLAESARGIELLASAADAACEVSAASTVMRRVDCRIEWFIAAPSMPAQPARGVRLVAVVLFADVFAHAELRRPAELCARRPRP